LKPFHQIGAVSLESSIVVERFSPEIDQTLCIFPNQIQEEQHQLQQSHHSIF
jgi:hypothetical protein